ncbi:MAG: hypothetical protein K2R98_31470 [Gemmataceae bacterium]|nr:hypothetical protein [Gemmataceae bacterium]
MTEREWLRCDDPTQMFTADGLQFSERKLRLFACACCALMKRHLTHQSLLKSLLTVAKYADGFASVKELKESHHQATEICTALLKGSRESQIKQWAAAKGVVFATYLPTGRGRKWRVDEWTKSEYEEYYVIGWEPAWSAFRVLNDKKFAHAASLVRHIVGNPFRPFVAPPSCPSPARLLAEAIYSGEDCAFALHDALLDAGHVELAEHFREKEHPKGCWALDLILGKS